jgi:formylglycine-generating enzyme
MPAVLRPPRPASVSLVSFPPLFVSLASCALAAVACSTAPPERTHADASSSASPPSVSAVPAAVADSGGDAGEDAGGDSGAVDEGTLHYETKEELLALFSIRRPPKRDSNADGFLQKSFGPGSPSLINQGNKALARHAIGRAQCLAGLAGLTLQTEAQRATCGGRENMVPVWKRGKKPKACIDVFEFPNKPCELPMVWVAPVQAKLLCELEGKRLCSQEEWTLACNGDPEGGKPSKFAYGDEMDLEVCNTDKPLATFSPGCVADSAATAWKTCATNTEPAGAFPRCRSRFGVFDQHGNVAEIMGRLDPDGHWYSQLKGSAFFYVDVARKPDERPPKDRETYPDHCAYDPRWHVEPLNEAWHVNYHLGFRCCASVR